MLSAEVGFQRDECQQRSNSEDHDALLGHSKLDDLEQPPDHAA
jgi:hypothetical protein